MAGRLMMNWEAEARKQRRKETRREKIKVRERRWVAQYEASQARALGDEAYKLPAGPIA